MGILKRLNMDPYCIFADALCFYKIFEFDETKPLKIRYEGQAIGGVLRQI